MSRRKPVSVLVTILMAVFIAVMTSVSGWTAQAESQDLNIEQDVAEVVPRAWLPLAFKAHCPDFFDDFSNPNSGWPVGSEASAEYGYFNGEYRVYAKGNYVLSFLAPSCPRLAYSVSVDSRWLGEPGTGYGIVFGVTDDLNRGYYFEINTTDQTWRLLSLGSSGWDVAIWPQIWTGINTGNQVNTLSVRFNGGKGFRFYINGVYTGDTLQYGDLPLAHVGFASSNAGQSWSDARFDNFEYWQPLTVPVSPGRSKAPDTCDHCQGDSWMMQDLPAWEPAHQQGIQALFGGLVR